MSDRKAVKLKLRVNYLSWTVSQSIAKVCKNETSEVGYFGNIFRKDQLDMTQKVLLVNFGNLKTFLVSATFTGVETLVSSGRCSFQTERVTTF